MKVRILPKNFTLTSKTPTINLSQIFFTTIKIFPHFTFLLKYYLTRCTFTRVNIHAKTSDEVIIQS